MSNNQDQKVIQQLRDQLTRARVDQRNAIQSGRASDAAKAAGDIAHIESLLRQYGERP